MNTVFLVFCSSVFGYFAGISLIGIMSSGLEWFLQNKECAKPLSTPKGCVTLHE